LHQVVPPFRDDATVMAMVGKIVNSEEGKPYIIVVAATKA
jgi:hypothetical protein